MEISHIRSQGGYTCEHCKIHKSNVTPKTGCCGRTRAGNFTPICTLVGTVCPGLIHCPRLDPVTKSELVKKWRADLMNKKQIDPSKFEA